MARAEPDNKSPGKRRNKSITEMFTDGTTIDEAVKAGAREALRLHKLAGQPVVVMRNGKIVWVSPDEIEPPE